MKDVEGAIMKRFLSLAFAALCLHPGGALAPTFYFYAQPSGGDDAPGLTTALAGNPHVVLTPGYYRVCSQVEVPRYKHLSAFGATVWQGSGAPGWVPPYPLPGETVVGSNGCPNTGNGSFAVSGQGYFHLHDQTIIEGFAIQGQRQIGGHRQINCINAVNSVSPLIQDMDLVDCYYSIDRESSATAGDQGTTSQGAVIRHNIFSYSENIAILCGVNGGSGCADEVYTEDEFDVTGQVAGPAIYCNTCQQTQITNSRFEDASLAIWAAGAQHLVITGNLINREAALVISGSQSNDILFANNKMSGVEATACPGGVALCQYAIELLASSLSYGLVIADNMCDYNYISCFKVDSAAYIFQSKFHDMAVPFNLVPLYADTHSASQILANSPRQPSAELPSQAGAGYDSAVTLLNVTLATGAAAGPTGDLVAARLTETAVTGGHTAAMNAGIALIAANTYTNLFNFARGSSGTRTALINLSDGTHTVQAIFDPATCNLVTSSTAGGGTIVGTPNAISLGNGWCRGAISFTGLMTTTISIGLASGSTTSYLGTGNDVLFSYSDTIAGVVAPGMWGLMQ